LHTDSGGPNYFYDPIVGQDPYYAVCGGFVDYPWIPLHPKCLEIRQRVVDFKKSIPELAESCGATSLGELYEIYHARCESQTHSAGPWPTDPPLIVLHKPHGYYDVTAGHGDHTCSGEYPELLVSTHECIEPRIETDYFYVAIRSLSVSTFGDNRGNIFVSITSSEPRIAIITRCSKNFSASTNRNH
jgi:hypothetical protein